uniref:Uncharacterized protein n=1 Tax=Parascaris univalens TaxID=6257 RepID=A0A915A3Y1_PARUN
MYLIVKDSALSISLNERKRTRGHRLPLAMDRRRSDRGCTSSGVRSRSNISLSRVSAMRGSMLLCTVSTLGMTV